MKLGELLVARGLVSVADIEQGIQRQRTAGGRLGENLIALGLLTAEQLDGIIHDTPAQPRSVEDLGVSVAGLAALLLKFMNVQGCETPSDLSERLHLPVGLVRNLLDDLVQKKMAQGVGSVGEGVGQQIRYQLSERGREAALEALARSKYLGPAPVSLAAFQEQVLKQRITNEHITEADIRQCFAGLVVPEHFLQRIGPAVNAGRTILLFGPPGNGKTSIATRLAAIFTHIIYVPYAVEVDGQIMKVFDPTLHKTALNESQQEQLVGAAGLRREEFDARWVPCRRPVVVTGGELTLEMLDLSFSADAGFYEAPMHVKALGGTFIIDDFGRQLVSPETLLNRWIVPMESRVDFLKLNTGKSFYVPFDELIIFSTNLAPDDLMDPAFLRRIPYKIELYEPSRDDYRQIFTAVARHCGLDLPEDIFDHVVTELQAQGKHLAFYQPKFICDQVVARCKFQGTAPHFSREAVAEALSNLYVQSRYANEGKKAAH